MILYYKLGCVEESERCPSLAELAGGMRLPHAPPPLAPSWDAAPRPPAGVPAAPSLETPPRPAARNGGTRGGRGKRGLRAGGRAQAGGGSPRAREGAAAGLPTLLRRARAAPLRAPGALTAFMAEAMSS